MAFFSYPQDHVPGTERKMSSVLEGYLDSIHPKILSIPVDWMTSSPSPNKLTISMFPLNFISPIPFPRSSISSKSPSNSISAHPRTCPRACEPSAQVPPPHPLHAAGLPSFANEPAADPITDSKASEWLTQATDPSPTVRLRAILSCRHLTPSAAAPILHTAYDAGEKELQNRGFLALFLGYKPTARSFDILSTMVADDGQDEVRANAIAALGYLRDVRAVPMCLGCLRQGHWSMRTAAAVSLGMIAEAHPDVRGIVYDDLTDALKNANGDWGVVTACLGALGDIRDVRAVDLVKQFIDVDDFSVAQCAVEALGKMSSQKSLDILKGILDKDVHVNVLWAAELGIKAVEDNLRQECE